MNRSSSNNTLRAQVRTQHMPGSGTAGTPLRKGRTGSANRSWMWILIGLLLVGLIIFGITRLARKKPVKHIDAETGELPTKIVLVLGDEHAIGYAQQGDYSADARQETNRKLALADGGWVNISPFGNRNGLEVTLAESLEEAYPEDVIGIVKVAFDGASVDMYLPQSAFNSIEDGSFSLYEVLRDRIESVNRSIPDAEIVATVWHHNIYADQYDEKVGALVDALKKQTDNEAMPFLIGTQFSLAEYTAIVSELPADLQAELEELNGGVELLTARESAAAASQNVYLMNYEGLIVAQSDPQGYATIGDRYAQEIIELLK